MAIITLQNLNKEESRVVDDKAIALAELSRNFNVPEGFVITSEVFDYVLEHSGLKHKIQNLTSVLDPSDSEKLQNIANEIQRLIVKAELPEDVNSAVKEAYQSLAMDDTTPVEEMMDTKEPLVEIEAGPVNYLDEGVSMYNINSSDRFIEALLSAYGLHYSSQSLKKRLENGLEDRGVSVIVKRTLNPELSGKVKLKQNNIIIEAVFGYYADEIKESSDTYTLDWETLEGEVTQREQNYLAKVVDNSISTEHIPEDFVTKTKIDKIQEFASGIKSIFNEEVKEFEFTLKDKKLYVTSVGCGEEKVQEEPEEEYEAEKMEENIEDNIEESEDKSIFSVFKDQEEENPYYNREKKEYSLTAAKHSLGHAVLECSLTIRSRLKDSYRDLFGEEAPSGMGQVIEAISDQRPVPLAEDLGKISELSRKFTRDGRIPSADEVKYVFDTTQQFLNQFT